MSSTTPSAHAGARTNTTALPTLGLGAGPRSGQGNGNEGSGASFSEVLRDKIAAPKPEAAKPASTAPAPAASASKPATQPRKADAGQDGQAQASAPADAGATGETSGTVVPESGNTETPVDTRSRRPGKSAAGPVLKTGDDAAKAALAAQATPLAESCAADESAVVTTAESGEELSPGDETVGADVGVAQAILQMLNSPVPAQARPASAGSGANADADAATVQGESQAPLALAQALPAGAVTLPTPPIQAAMQSETAATQGSEASAAAASALQLREHASDQALLSAGEALFARTPNAPASQGPVSEAAATTPGSFAAHLQALSNPRSAQAGGSSAPSPVALAQPLHSPEFAPAMSARLALLAAEGVQQAMLQLNPAEMGPVSVQITVEGQQAQIAFHAVQADTRQVLEQSLPELAAALRDQGLTLSGGGVFEQSQQQAREQAQQAASGSRLNDQSGLASDTELQSAQAAARRPPAAPSRGMLDLYA